MRLDLQAYDIAATYGNGQAGRIQERLIDRDGELHLDRQLWRAGDVAYQFLKRSFPDGITKNEYSTLVRDFNSVISDGFYPDLLTRVRAGEIYIEAIGPDGLIEAWKSYDWVERAMLYLRFIEGIGFPSDEPMKHWQDSIVAAALLWRLDDAVISELLDGRDLQANVVEIVELRDRLQLPRHVTNAINDAEKSAGRSLAKRAANAKVANDPKQKDKASVRECWDEWRKQPSRYKGKAAFARDMLDKFPGLASQPVIEGWCRTWERES